MSFGAFCPAPYRLRNDPLNGWAASAHARLCADKSAEKRTGAFARLTFTLSAGAISGIALSGQHGADLPTFTVLGTGQTELTFGATYFDDYGVACPIMLRHAKATPHGSTATKAIVELFNANTLIVRTFDSATGAPADSKVTVKIWCAALPNVAPVQTGAASIVPEGRPAWSHDSDIGDYGGDFDKEDCSTEEVPYAWTWYREYGSMIGSAFTSVKTGEVHSKKLALARNRAGVDRAAERARNNGLPRTADEMLGSWVEVLGVPVGDNDRRRVIRKRAAAKFAAMLGPTRETVDQAIADTLGPVLISIFRNEGTSLSVPPSQTFWDGVNPGPASYDLGGGTWISERSKLGILAVRPTSMPINDFLRLVDTQLFSVLDPLLPMWADYYWTSSISGFLLDISLLDFDGLTPT